MASPAGADREIRENGWEADPADGGWPDGDACPVPPLALPLAAREPLSNGWGDGGRERVGRRSIVRIGAGDGEVVAAAGSAWH